MDPYRFAKTLARLPYEAPAGISNVVLAPGELRMLGADLLVYLGMRQTKTDLLLFHAA